MKKEYFIFGGIAAFLVVGGGVKLTVDLKNASVNEKKFAPFIKQMEQKYNLPDGILHRLIKQESAFRTDIITGKKKSPVGALGIAQFMPKTAIEELGSELKALEPFTAIEGAARYLKKQYDWTKKRGWVDAVAAYNWGAGNVNQWRDGARKMPTETKNYVKNILGVTV